jgi:hypothetical protein
VSYGKEKYVRRIKSEARRGVGNFDNNEQLAIKTLGEVYYHGAPVFPDKELLIKYWQIGSEYRKTNNWDKFVAESKDFYEGLDQIHKKSKSFNAALDLIRVWFG